MFQLKDLVTNATTGPLIPLSVNALLKAFLVARGEKLALVLLGDLTRISLFSLLGLLAFRVSLKLVVALALGFPTIVHSQEGLKLAPMAAIKAKDPGVELVLGIVLAVGRKGGQGQVARARARALARALALFPICLVAVLREVTQVVIIKEADFSLPFLVNSLKTSSRSSSLDCLSQEAARV